jgi:hypothetical protein
MRSKFIAIGTLAVGLALTPIVAFAAPGSGGTTSTTTPVSTKPATTPAKTASSTKTTGSTAATKTRTVADRFEVVAGTYRKSAAAAKHLKAIEAKGITGLTVKQIGTTAVPRFRVEERGLSRAAAAAKVKALHADKFAAYFVAR